jgi:hypothetical protein
LRTVVLKGFITIWQMRYVAIAFILLGPCLVNRLAYSASPNGPK